MTTNQLAPKLTDAKNIRCNVNHSGNHRLTFSVGYFQCAGCASFHTIEAVGAAMRGPVEQMDGSGGVCRLPAKPDEQWEAARVANEPKADCIEETLSFSINFSRGVIVANADIETARKIISDTGSTALPDSIHHRALTAPIGMICEGETLIAIRYNGQQTIRTEVRGPAEISNPNPRGTFGHAWITPIA